MKLGLLGFAENREKNLGVYRPESNSHIESFNGNPKSYTFYGSRSLTFSGLSETATNGLSFSSDGLYMFVVGDSQNTIYRYTLTTPWDITTSNGTVTNSLTLTTLNSNITSPTGVAFSSTGNKMYVSNLYTNIYEFNLSVNWQVSSASYVGTRDMVCIEIYDLTFSKDGKNLFIISRAPFGTTSIVGSACYVNIFSSTTATAWDNISNYEYQDNINYTLVEPFGKGIALSSNNNSLSIIGLNNAALFSFNRSNSTFSNVSSSENTNYDGFILGREGSPQAIFMNSYNGYDYYIIGANETVYQYKLILK